MPNMIIRGSKRHSKLITLVEQMIELQKRDVRQMGEIYAAARDEIDLNELCARFVGSGTFKLSPEVAAAIMNPEGAVAIGEKSGFGRIIAGGKEI